MRKGYKFSSNNLQDGPKNRCVQIGKKWGQIFHEPDWFTSQVFSLSRIYYEIICEGNNGPKTAYS